MFGEWSLDWFFEFLFQLLQDFFAQLFSVFG